MAAAAALCPVLTKNSLAKGIYEITIACPDMAAQAAPGQFVHIRCGGATLRRPISICGLDKAAGTMRLVFEERGEGTRWLARVGPGQALDVLGPLGNGFDFARLTGPAVFVGGGIGTPPLLGAAEAYLAAAPGNAACAILGFRSADAVILGRDFEAAGVPVRLATDDGTAGRRGLVTELLRERLAEGRPAAVFACGPRPMLRGVASLAREAGAPCFVSMEERMACGVGACLGCAIKVVAQGREQYRHVCKDGPVFDAESVVW
jgi:dihydroorotate dehydrogenase electron transfer subunit